MKHWSWHYVREQEQYKNPSNDNGWRHPPVEEVELLPQVSQEYDKHLISTFHWSFQFLVFIYFCYQNFFIQVLAKLVTHFVKVHSRQCIDEAELAEHVVGLTSSLASCQFRYLVPVCTFVWRLEPYCVSQYAMKRIRA